MTPHSPAMRPVARLLVAAVRQDREPWDWDALEPRLVLTAGHEHRVTPAVFRLAAGLPGVPAELLAPLAAVRHRQLLRHLRALADLRSIGATLNEAGISWCVVKGPVLTEFVWPAPDMREYADLDILVAPRQAEKALDALTSAGSTLIDRNWPYLASTMRAELALTAPAGTAVDLHWHLLVDAKLRRQFDLRILPILDRASPRVLGGGVTAPVPHAVDMVHHLALHTASSGADRLMWLGDLHYATRLVDYSGAELIKATLRAGTTLPTRLVLDRVTRVFGDDAWQADLRRAPGRWWSHVVGLRDRYRPVPSLPGDRHRGGSLYTGARSSTLRSIGGTVSELVAQRWVEAHPERHTTAILNVDAPDPTSRRDYFANAANSR